MVKQHSCKEAERIEKDIFMCNYSFDCYYKAKDNVCELYLNGVLTLKVKKEKGLNKLIEDPFIKLRGKN